MTQQNHITPMCTHDAAKTCVWCASNNYNIRHGDGKPLTAPDDKGETEKAVRHG